MMSTDDVLSILELLQAGGVDVWLGGGWGIDALLGEQTRLHSDLDIAISHVAETSIRSVLQPVGFRQLPADNAFNFVLADAAGREVDIHLVDFESTRLDERGTEVYGPRGLAYELGSLEGHGVIAGRVVACETPEFQMKGHTRYVPAEKDVRDVMALHHAFGLPLPPPYDELRSEPL